MVYFHLIGPEERGKLGELVELSGFSRGFNGIDLLLESHAVREGFTLDQVLSGDLQEEHVFLFFNAERGVFFGREEIKNKLTYKHGLAFASALFKHAAGNSKQYLRSSIEGLKEELGIEATSSLRNSAEMMACLEDCRAEVKALKSKGAQNTIKTRGVNPLEFAQATERELVRTRRVLEETQFELGVVRNGKNNLEEALMKFGITIETLPLEKERVRQLLCEMTRLIISFQEKFGDSKTKEETQKLELLLEKEGVTENVLGFIKAKMDSFKESDDALKSMLYRFYGSIYEAQRLLFDKENVPDEAKEVLSEGAESRTFMAKLESETKIMERIVSRIKELEIMLAKKDALLKEKEATLKSKISSELEVRFIQGEKERLHTLSRSRLFQIIHDKETITRLIESFERKPKSHETSLDLVFYVLEEYQLKERHAREKIEEYDAKLRESDEKFRQLEAHVRRQDLEITEHEFANSKLENTCSFQKEEIAALRSSLSSLNAKSAQLEISVKKQREIIENLEKEKDSLEEGDKENKKEIAKLEAKIKAQNEMLARSKSFGQDLAAKVEKLEAELKEADQSLRNMQAMLNEEKKRLAEEKRQDEGRIEELEQEIQKERANFTDQRIRIKQQLTDSKLEVSNLRQEVITLSGQVQSKVMGIEQQDRELHETKTELRRARSKLAQLSLVVKQEREDFKSESRALHEKSLQEEIHESETKKLLEEKEREIEALKVEVAFKEAKLKESDREIKTLQQRIDFLDASMAMALQEQEMNSKNLEELTTTHKEEVKVFREQEAVLRATFKKARDETKAKHESELLEQKRKLELEIKEVKNSLGNTSHLLKETQEEMEGMHNELELVNSKLEEQERLDKEKDLEIRTLIANIEERERSLGESSELLKSQEKSIDELEKERVKLSRQVAALEEESQRKLSLQAQEYRGHIDRLAKEFETDLAELEEDLVKDQQSKLKEKDKENAEKVQKLEKNLVKKIEELKKVHDKRMNEATSSLEAHISRLEETKRELEERISSERTEGEFKTSGHSKEVQHLKNQVSELQRSLKEEKDLRAKSEADLVADLLAKKDLELAKKDEEIQLMLRKFNAKTKTLQSTIQELYQESTEHKLSFERVIQGSEVKETMLAEASELKREKASLQKRSQELQNLVQNLLAKSKAKEHQTTVMMKKMAQDKVLSVFNEQKKIQKEQRDRAAIEQEIAKKDEMFAKEREREQRDRAEIEQKLAEREEMISRVHIARRKDVLESEENQKKMQELLRLLESTRKELADSEKAEASNKKLIATLNDKLETSESSLRKALATHNDVMTELNGQNRSGRQADSELQKKLKDLQQEIELRASQNTLLAKEIQERRKEEESQKNEIMNLRKEVMELTERCSEEQGRTRMALLNAEEAQSHLGKSRLNQEVLQECFSLIAGLKKLIGLRGVGIQNQQMEEMIASSPFLFHYLMDSEAITEDEIMGLVVDTVTEREQGNDINPRA